MIKSIAKQVVHREISDKTVGGIVENSVPHNAQINVGDLYPLLPPLAVGVGDTQRTHNRIRPKSLELRCRVALNESANLTTPYHVDVWVLACRRVKTYNNSGLLQMPINQLLDGGNGVNSPFDGTTMNALLPINTDAFTVLKHRRFKLSTTTAENHKAQSSAQMTLRIKCPASLHYDESQATVYPENFAPICVMGWSRDDGIQPDPASTHVTMTSWSIMKFEDA